MSGEVLVWLLAAFGGMLAALGGLMAGLYTAMRIVSIIAQALSMRTE